MNSPRPCHASSQIEEDRSAPAAQGSNKVGTISHLPSAPTASHCCNRPVDKEQLAYDFSL